MTHFQQRIIMGSLSILLVGLGIYFSYHPLFRPLYVLINAAVISMAVIEYYHLAENKGFHPLSWFGVGCTTAYVIASYLGIKYPSAAELPSLILLGALILFFLYYFYQPTVALGNLAVSTFAIVYLTIPLTYGLKITYFSEGGPVDGRLWLVYILIVTKITDIGAYLFGSLMGKIKLAPMISPKKTVEGAAGGLVAALLASIAFYFLLTGYYSIEMTLWQGIWLGLIIGVLSQFGDLAESILKRDAGVKDSSKLPGLGGILDIVDSLVFTLPLMYVLLKMGFFE
jgi:phosphatidate cytidylyltransferase